MYCLASKQVQQYLAYKVASVLGEAGSESGSARLMSAISYEDYMHAILNISAAWARRNRQGSDNDANFHG